MTEFTKPALPPADGRAQCWRFAECVLDGPSLEFRVRGQLVKLEPKPLELLMFLLRHAGEVVTKDELLEGLWPGRVLSESVLTKCVAKLRHGLGDEDQAIIKTVHGYGYRLVAPVTVEAAAPAPAVSSGLVAGLHPPLRPLWSLRENLGSGAYGEVWLATHDKTGEQRVFKFARDAASLAALKREITLYRVLRATHGDRADFVRLLDWNLEELPYFIEAEYLAAGDLPAWVERQGGLEALPIVRRLELAAQLADTLAAAHAAGVLHKDLKPGNVLVEEGAAGVRLKLADFGSGAMVDLARLERLEITRLGFTQLADYDGAGTPAYLAPELLAGQAPTVKSDIFALGVILYQMLVADWRRPLAPGWEQALGDELLREDVAAAAAGNPAQRIGDAGELARRLRSLAQRRDERALQRRSEAESKRLREALERTHLLRALVAALVLGIALSTWGFLHARRAQEQAESAAAEARAAVDFLSEDVLAATDPFGGGRPTLSIKGLLDEAAPRLQQRLADYPAVRAQMGLAMGRAYEGLGDWIKARERLSVARDEAASSLGEDAALTLAIAERLAYVAMLQSRYDESQDLYGQVYAVRRARLGDRHLDTLSARDGLAWLEYERGNFAEAARRYEALVADYGKVDERGRTSAQWSLADAYLELNRRADAESLMREVIIATSRLQGADHPRTLWQHTTLGDALMMQGRWDEAAAVFDRAYAGLARTAGEVHPYTLTALHYRGQLQLERGQPLVALPLLRRAYENRLQAHGADHVWTRYSANRVGEALVQLGLAGEALPLLQAAHEQGRRVQGAEHPNVLLIQRNLADALLALGRLEEAEKLLAEGVALATAGLPPSNVRIAYLRQSLGRLRQAQHREGEAQAEFKAAHAIYVEALGEAHPATQNCLASIAPERAAATSGRHPPATSPPGSSTP